MSRLLQFLILIVPLVSNCQETLMEGLSSAAIELTETEVTYDPSYFIIDYPNGDIPLNKGVCTDVVVRAYRLLGIDLQQLIHEDMKADFDSYPKIWGLTKPDPNIDHRRVPNLRIFFTRHGDSLPLSNSPDDYKSGDIVTWDLGHEISHIGIVVNQFSFDGVPLIVHNIGAGQVIENCLLRFTITGHYQYRGP